MGLENIKASLIERFQIKLDKGLEEGVMHKHLDNESDAKAPIYLLLIRGSEAQSIIRS